MSGPEISVVMGVRNEGSALRSTVESVLSQADVELEFLIVDDGSTDGTSEMIRSLADSDSRVRGLSSEGGLTRALISGCAAARGEFIARQDCGDWSLPGRLRGEAELLRSNSSVGLVCCASEFVGPEGDHLYVSRGHGDSTDPTDIAPVHPGARAFVGPSHHGAVMFRKSAYVEAGGYRGAFYFGQDWDLWYRMAGKWKFQLHPSVLYRATIRASGISMARRREQQAFAGLSFEGWNLRSRGESDAPAVERASALCEREGSAVPSRADEAAAWYFLGECLRRNRNPRASEYLRRATKLDSLHWKAWLRWMQSRALK